jgi:SiaC family regulatory phosphoprotein
MINLKINPTDDTPLIDFNIDTSIFKMSGISIPENPIAFFVPIQNWVIEYVGAKKDGKLKVILDFEYFNTSTVKFIIILLKEFKKAAEHNNQLTILWEYMQDDDDMLETGRELSELVEIPFEYAIKS